MEESLKLKINNTLDLLKSSDIESKILGLGILLEILPSDILNIVFNPRDLYFLSNCLNHDYFITLQDMIKVALGIYNDKNLIFTLFVAQICSIISSLKFK